MNIQRGWKGTKGCFTVRSTMTIISGRIQTDKCETTDGKISMHTDKQTNKQHPQRGNAAHAPTNQLLS